MMTEIKIDMLRSKRTPSTNNVSLMTGLEREVYSRITAVIEWLRIVLYSFSQNQQGQSRFSGGLRPWSPHVGARGRAFSHWIACFDLALVYLYVLNAFSVAEPRYLAPIDNQQRPMYVCRLWA